MMRLELSNEETVVWLQTLVDAMAETARDPDKQAAAERRKRLEAMFDRVKAARG